MSEGSEPVERDTVRYTVLSPKTIWAAAAVIVLVGIGVAIWLLIAYGRGDAQQRNQLEAIKTAGTIVVGTGGAAALLLAARRQRTAEIALKQKELDQEAVARTHALQERMADDTRQDAEERRLTELYTRAVEQLGSDKPPVQLGGLYALERLGQGNADQRQTIVNVLCAYLRMFTDVAEDVTEDRVREQERRVRRAAQTILAAHLRPGGISGMFWADIDIDLSGASLLDFDLSLCLVRSAAFQAATFVGDARFVGTTFTDRADFESVTFSGRAEFDSVKFRRNAMFESVIFTGAANFALADFAGTAWFESSTFAAESSFELAMFKTGLGSPGVPFEELPPDVARNLRPLRAKVPYADVADLGRDAKGKRVPIGIAAKDLEPVYLDFSADPHYLAFMGLRSGKTNLLRTIVRGIENRYTPKEALIILVDFRRTMLGFTKPDFLLGYAIFVQQLKEIMADVGKSLSKRLPGPDVTQEQLKNRSWWTGPDVFVIVDDYELVPHRDGNPLEPLLEFLPQAKDVGLHLIIARNTKGADAALHDAVLGELRYLLTPGLVGHGDPAEGSLVSSIRPAKLMPGRANAFSRHDGQRLIQIAWLGPED